MAHGMFTSENSEMKIPAGRDPHLMEDLLLISGAGRSGTTILGKLAGSMAPACYLFEPVFARLMPFLLRDVNPTSSPLIRMMKTVLFEDYFLPVLQGRGLNFNKEDDSYFGHYFPEKTLSERWQTASRRQSAMELARKIQPVFILKIPELQPLFVTIRTLFQKARFLHILRNGTDVVGSSVHRGWFSDDYLEKSYLNWTCPTGPQRKNFAPWFLDEESKTHFRKWNIVTRNASVWRSLVESGLRYSEHHPDSAFTIRYEEFISDPEEYIGKLETWTGMKSTELTEKHLEAIRNHTSKPYRSIADEIEMPEAPKFRALMDRLEYR